MKIIKLFVLGDSISMHYGPYLKEYLDERFDYDRKRDKGISKKDLLRPVGGNGGDSRRVLEYLLSAKKAGRLNYDYILLNCGLHDIKRDSKTKALQVPEREYGQNLELAVRLLKKAGPSIIWVRLTHVDDKIHRARCKGFYRLNKDVNNYNRIADRIMNKSGVKTIDLNSFTKKLKERHFVDHVHFTKTIRALQAAHIAGYLMREITNR